MSGIQLLSPMAYRVGWTAENPAQNFEPGSWNKWWRGTGSNCRHLVFQRVVTNLPQDLNNVFPREA